MGRHFPFRMPYMQPTSEMPPAMMWKPEAQGCAPQPLHHSTLPLPPPPPSAASSGRQSRRPAAALTHPHMFTPHSGHLITPGPEFAGIPRRRAPPSSPPHRRRRPQLELLRPVRHGARRSSASLCRAFRGPCRRRMPNSGEWSECGCMCRASPLVCGVREEGGFRSIRL